MRIQNCITSFLGLYTKNYYLTPALINQFTLFCNLIENFRGDDSVIYGHQSIGSRLFYKQSASSQCGLPPPADVMGTISKQARRHLERDHSIILF